MFQKIVIAVSASFSALVAIYILKRLSGTKTKTLPNLDSTDEKTNNNLDDVKQTNPSNGKLNSAQLLSVDKFESHRQNDGLCKEAETETPNIKSCTDKGNRILELSEDSSCHAANLTNGLGLSTSDVNSLSSEKVISPGIQSVDVSVSDADDQKAKSVTVDVSNKSVNEEETFFLEKEVLDKDEVLCTDNLVPVSDSSNEESSKEFIGDDLVGLEHAVLNGNESARFCDDAETLVLSSLETCSDALKPLPSSASPAPVELSLTRKELVLLNKHVEDSITTPSINYLATGNSVVNISSTCASEEDHLLHNSSLANVVGNDCLKDLLVSPIHESLTNGSSVPCKIPTTSPENGIGSCKSDCVLSCKSRSKVQDIIDTEPAESNLDCTVPKFTDEQTCEVKNAHVDDDSAPIDDIAGKANLVCKVSTSVCNNGVGNGQLDLESPCKSKSSSSIDCDKSPSDVSDKDASDCEIHASSVDEDESHKLDPLSTCDENCRGASATLPDNVPKESCNLSQNSGLEAPTSLLNQDLETFKSDSSLVCEDEINCCDILTPYSHKELVCFKSDSALEDSEEKNEAVIDADVIILGNIPINISISDSQGPASSVDEGIESLQSDSLPASEWNSGERFLDDVPSNSNSSGIDVPATSSNDDLESYKHESQSTCTDEMASINDSGKENGDDTATDSSPSACEVLAKSAADDSVLCTPKSLLDCEKDVQEDSGEVSSMTYLSANSKSIHEMSLKSADDVQPSSKVSLPSAYENKSENFSEKMEADIVTAASAMSDGTSMSSNHYGSAWSNGTGTSHCNSDSVVLNDAAKLEEDVKVDTFEINHFYDNHRNLQLHTQQGSHPTDYKRLWPQPNDGLVFVPSSPGQPLVPGYLRNLEFLRNRFIPSHDPARVAYLAKTMASLHYVPESWVRIISVSDDLQLRVRTDQRDMLCDLMERMGICNPRSRPPRAETLEVGSFVAARLEVPQKGVVWCRVHITEVIRPPEPEVPERRLKNNRSKQNWRTPEPLFMVESIDHYPAASTQPLRAIDLRNLTDQAWNAPFYDQTISLLNTMPLDGLAYGSAAREFLLDTLRKGGNFVRVAALFSTIIDGFMNYFGSLESYADCTTGAEGLVHLERHLKSARLATSIYSGSLSSRYFFQCCMFQGGQAFWCNDNRGFVTDTVSRGPSHPLQEYAFLCYEHGPIVVGFRGFKFPYVHKVWFSKKLGLNVNMHELCVLMKHPLSFIGDPEQVLQQILSVPDSIFRMGLYAEALHAIYLAELSCKPGTQGMHYAFYFTQRHSVPLALPKDELNFLIPDSTFNFGKVYSVETLRKPLPA
ncbi:hypothetical protein FHG87_004127 [Trinorchestia longiramus]|nr:hypothetical protein FHG87_004127 [Trinorchestia longiramus]